MTLVEMENLAKRECISVVQINTAPKVDTGPTEVLLTSISSTRIAETESATARKHEINLVVRIFVEMI